MPPPAQAAAKPGALEDFLEDIDRLFWLPRPMPAPADRARALVDSIDWSQPTIVVWVPGTNDHEVPDHLRRRLATVHGPAAYCMDYVSTWQVRTSEPDGEATLRELLSLVARHKRPGQKFVLIGESQGAWVISEVLKDPMFASIVDRASLLAHPALASAHAHDSTSTDVHLDPKRVHEFNTPGDVVTREVGKSSSRVIDLVDSFASLRIGRSLGLVGEILLTDPGLVQALIASQLFRVNGTQNPHSSEALMQGAVDWILERPADTSSSH